MTGGVLVVDDDPSLAESLRAALASHNVTVDAATDTASAAAMLDGGTYCGLVLDLVLPDGNGFDVLRHIEREHIRIAIVVVSAKLPGYVREMLDAEQVKLVFPKPVDARLLGAVVLGMCGIAN
jgi:DNA-binding response OmpR family regulator